MDSVLAIRKGLTSSDEETTSAPTNNGPVSADPLVGKVDGECVPVPDNRVVAETVNGVPVYADGGVGNPSAAIFP